MEDLSLEERVATLERTVATFAGTQLGAKRPTTAIPKRSF